MSLSIPRRLLGNDAPHPPISPMVFPGGEVGVSILTESTVGPPSVVSLVTRGQVHRSLKTWRQYVFARRLVVRIRNRLVGRKYFGLWYGRYSHCSSRRKAINGFVSKRSVNLAVAVIREWKARVPHWIRLRRSAEAVTGLVTKRIRCQVLASWRYHVFVQRVHQRGLLVEKQLFQFRVLRNTFRRWMQCYQHFEQRRREEWERQECVRGVKKRWLGVWRVRSGHNRSMQAHRSAWCARALVFHQSKGVREVLARWVEITRNLGLRKSRGTTLVATLRRRKCNRFLRTWRQRSAAQRNIRVKLLHMSAKVQVKNNKARRFEVLSWAGDGYVSPGRLWQKLNATIARRWVVWRWRRCVAPLWLLKDVRLRLPY